MGAHVHLAALDAHVDALSAGSERQPRQRAGLAQQSSYAGIYIDDLQGTTSASPLRRQLGAQHACSCSAAHGHNALPGLHLDAWHGKRADFGQAMAGPQCKGCSFGMPKL